MPYPRAGLHPPSGARPLSPRGERAQGVKAHMKDRLVSQAFHMAMSPTLRSFCVTSTGPCFWTR